MDNDELPLSSAITGAPIILFTGAGASVPLGLSASKQFPEDVLNLPELALGSKKILEALSNLIARDSYDLESMVSNLIDAQSSTELMTRLHSEAQHCGFEKTSLTDFGLAVNDTADLVLSHFVSHYSDVDSERAGRLYFWLSLWLQGYQTDWGPLPFFTTNYDWVFESAVDSWKKSSHRLVDGFRASNFGLTWQPEVFHRLKGSQHKLDVVLFKLHGSTSWFTLPNGQIVKIPYAERNPGSLYSALVYPGFVKDDYLSVDPFATAYKYLDACLKEHTELCVVIGFSFRDEPINNIFSDALRENPHLHLIIVDPYPDKPWLTSSLGLNDDNVTFIEKPFEYYGMTTNKTLNETIVARMSSDSIFLRRH